MDAGGERGTAVVTGASSGIGRAFAERLARDGHDLLLTARRADRLERLAQELRGRGVRVDVVPADLEDEADLRSFAARVAALESLTLLVNNAGRSTFGRFDEVDVDGEVALAELFVAPTLRLTHAALRALRGRSGAVVHVSSRAALQPHPRIAAYSGAKAFVNAFAQALSLDPALAHVRQLAVCPGLTRTELFDRAGLDTADIDPRSWLTPEEVVDAALRDLARGELVCVPGARGRGEWLRRLVPRPVLRRAAGVLRRLARV